MVISSRYFQNGWVHLASAHSIVCVYENICGVHSMHACRPFTAVFHSRPKLLLCLSQQVFYCYVYSRPHCKLCLWKHYFVTCI